MGEQVSPSRAWIYPPTFSFPDPAEQIPPGYDSAARRGGNNNNNNNNTMACLMGPVPSIAAREFLLIRLGNGLSSLTLM